VGGSGGAPFQLHHSSPRNSHRWVSEATLAKTEYGQQLNYRTDNDPACQYGVTAMACMQARVAVWRGPILRPIGWRVLTTNGPSADLEVTTRGEISMFVCRADADGFPRQASAARSKPHPMCGQSFAPIPWQDPSSLDAFEPNRCGTA
jgi:hypothetical protein